MEIKKKIGKKIKQITALGMGATLMGATILGAAATDLGNYPGMFIENGQFNGLLVVGENSKSIDTIGMVNIALGLQAEAYTETTICEGDEGFVIEDGVKIETSARKLYQQMTLAEIKPTLDNTDLPVILADGNYRETQGATSNDEDYTQKIELLQQPTGTFPRGVTNLLTVTQDDDDAPNAGYYLVMGDRTPAYRYVLEFDNPVKFDENNVRNDFIGTTIEIQGLPYTITDAKARNGMIDELQMLVGDNVQWITQGQTITHTHDGVEHTVRMVQITDEAQPACGLEIDGSIRWLDKGDTYTSGGLTVGVHDVRPIRTADFDSDICKISLGTQKLVLTHGDEVSKDGRDIEGSRAYLHSRATDVDRVAGEWAGLTIQWTPDSTLYLPFEGDLNDRQLVDPVFGNFMYVASGIQQDLEEIEFKLRSRSGDITFANSGGVEVELQLARSGSNVFLGDGSDIDDRIYFTSTTGDGESFCEFTYQNDVHDMIDECEGARWLLSASGEAHIIELRDIRWSSTNNEYTVDVTDTVYDRRDTGNRVTLDGGETGTGTFYVTGLGTVTMEVTDDGTNGGAISFYTNYAVDNHDGSNNRPIETEYGMVLKELSYDTTGDRTLRMTWEEKEASKSDGNRAVVSALIYDNNGDLELDISGGLDHFSAPISYSRTNDDDLVYTSARGTWVIYDSDDDQEMRILYPATDVYGEVYIAPSAATVSENGTGTNCHTVREINRIPSTVNKFDTELANVSPTNIPQNMITVGGPCANMVTAALMGNPENCEEGFEDGMAILKLMEHNDKIALIVAGGAGEDTRIASTVLKNFRDYQDELVGKELILTTVSETSIGFESVE